MGAGLEMKAGDVAFKCNFATVDDIDDSTTVIGRSVLRRRVDRKFPDWGVKLCDYLDNTRLEKFPNVRISVKYATEHR